MRKYALIFLALLLSALPTGCDKIQELIPSDESDEDEAPPPPAEAAATETPPAAAPAPAAPAPAPAAPAPAAAAPAPAADAPAPTAAEEATANGEGGAEAAAAQGDDAAEAETEPADMDFEVAPEPRRAAPAAATEEAGRTRRRAPRSNTRASQVARAVRTAAARCYEGAGASGAVSVRVQVGADGRAFRGSVTQNDTGNQEVARCISGALIGHRFDAAPASGDDGTYDVSFSR